MNKTAGIFRLTNSLEGFKYIGYSKQIEVCTSDYNKWATRGKHPNPKLQEAFNKGGEFKVEILEVMEKSSRKLLAERKEYWEQQPVEVKAEQPEPTGKGDRDAEIMAAIDSGKSISETARMFGVSDRTVCRVKRKARGENRP